MLGIEELLCSLGPFASEGAVFSGDCDGQPWEVVVAPSEEAGSVALSQSRLEEIDPLVDDLTARTERGWSRSYRLPGREANRTVVSWTAGQVGSPFLFSFNTYWEDPCSINSGTSVANAGGLSLPPWLLSSRPAPAATRRSHGGE